MQENVVVHCVLLLQWSGDPAAAISPLCSAAAVVWRPCSCNQSTVFCCCSGLETLQLQSVHCVLLLQWSGDPAAAISPLCSAAAVVWTPCSCNQSTVFCCCSGLETLQLQSVHCVLLLQWSGDPAAAISPLCSAAAVVWRPCSCNQSTVFCCCSGLDTLQLQSVHCVLLLQWSGHPAAAISPLCSAAAVVWRPCSCNQSTVFCCCSGLETLQLQSVQSGEGTTREGLQIHQTRYTQTCCSGGRKTYTTENVGVPKTSLIQDLVCFNQRV
ncbi:Hypp917 [Branchiostoma lanceolatum]|uniref:Hypp917 protein n=1 Tax=Branchiostoma lanceolatum TaxID=7740 RepID=A0A8K0ELC8_BRALA|nr:Hypp917 [Branchiostoma lanceolatum]